MTGDPRDLTGSLRHGTITVPRTGPAIIGAAVGPGGGL